MTDRLSDCRIKQINETILEAINDGDFDAAISEAIRNETNGAFDDAIKDHITDGYLDEFLVGLIGAGEFDDAVRERAVKLGIAEEAS